MGKHDSIPFFSVVIPALNEEDYLPNLLLDLAKQTFQDFEIILVDGNSEDQTIQKARHFQEKFRKFTILKSGKRNVAHQRNIGAQRALADWLIFSDADNRLPNRFLGEIKHLIEIHKSDFLSTWSAPDSADLKDKVIALLRNLAIEIHKNTPYPFLLEAFVCVKKEAFVNLGGFDETIPFREGSALLKRAYAVNMHFIFNRQPQFIYSSRRLRKEGILKTLRNTVLIEIASLTNYKISQKASNFLYPMEGGKYFELSTRIDSWNERFSDKAMKLTKR